ncbi:MAG TPA: hypothetical protein VKA65_04075, partial [Acidimicrobiales bacterium]|nr:hypothetical protein [Acidimicrobiales bacterium]
WAVLYGLTWAVTDPRRVKPGPRTLELPGSEPPAVVALLAHDWVLGREALPATLLDLAARGYLAIDSVGDDTLVRARGTSGSVANDRMSDYERMVYEHVSALASRAHDGVVHARPLTTGPGDESDRWWKRCRKAVVGDAQDRGLSRPRFSPAAKVMLTVAAVVVAVAVAVATTTIRDTDPADDDDPAGLFVFTGIGSSSTLVGMLACLRGERDGSSYHTYVAVDDGTAARVAAWRFKGNMSAPRHSVVRGRVTRYLHHVRDYEVASGVGPTSIGDATTPG